jgi:hypothetical protein
MAKLFGFSIDDTDDRLKSKSVISPVPPNNDDGVDNFISSGFYGQYLDIEGVYRTEFDLIKRYREMALHPECDNAIEDVVNEAIVSDLYDSPVEIELSNLNASDKLKQKIREEFKNIKEMLDFDKKSHEIFRNWYVDGKLYYMKVIDVKKPHDGILDLRYIDPMKMKYVRQEKKTNRNDLVNLTNVNETQKIFFPEIEEYYLQCNNDTTKVSLKRPRDETSSTISAEKTKSAIQQPILAVDLHSLSSLLSLIGHEPTLHLSQNLHLCFPLIMKKQADLMPCFLALLDINHV